MFTCVPVRVDGEPAERRVRDEAGQLEDEVARNAWLTVPVDESLLFEVPAEDRWQAAGRLLGINLLHLSSEAGHA